MLDTQVQWRVLDKLVHWSVAETLVHLCRHIGAAKLQHQLRQLGTSTPIRTVRRLQRKMKLEMAVLPFVVSEAHGYGAWDAAVVTARTEVCSPKY